MYHLGMCFKKLRFENIEKKSAFSNHWQGCVFLENINFTKLLSTVLKIAFSNCIFKSHIFKSLFFNRKPIQALNTFEN